MRFAFIHTEKARCTVQALCRALDVSPSGFYAWCRQPESAHAQRDRQLRVLIRASHEASRYRYGSPRVHEDLIEQGVPISRKRVVRLMRAEGLTARVRKRFKCTTMSDHDQPVAANVLGQDFVAEAPNQRWVGDTTEFVIGSSGTLYLAAILDLYSRFLVGWAVSAINDRHLVIKALRMALKRREPAAGLLPSLRPRESVCEPGLPADHHGASDDRQHEPSRELLRQRRDGELVFHGQAR